MGRNFINNFDVILNKRITHGEWIANDLVEKFDIDRSYMSRIIAKLI